MKTLFPWKTWRRNPGSDARSHLPPPRREIPAPNAIRTVKGTAQKFLGTSARNFPNSCAKSVSSQSPGLCRACGTTPEPGRANAYPKGVAEGVAPKNALFGIRDPRRFPWFQPPWARVCAAFWSRGSSFLATPGCGPRPLWGGGSTWDPHGIANGPGPRDTELQDCHFPPSIVAGCLAVFLHR